MPSARARIRTTSDAGYITLLSVLVIGSVATTIALSLLVLGVDTSRTGLTIFQSAQARGLVNACAAEALEQIRLSASYTGSGNLSLGSGTCSYTVTNGQHGTKTIVASGAVGTIVRKLSLTVERATPPIILSTWQEVP